MNVMDAAKLTVHDYPGGSESLGPRVAIKPAVLRNKINPNNDGNHLTLAEVMRIQVVTDDHRVCRAMNEELGYLPPIPRVDAVVVSDSALLETYTKMMSELGDVSREFHKALADGRGISRSELADIRTQMLEFFAAGEELLARAEQIAED
jgi:hypothetical protein